MFAGLAPVAFIHQLDNLSYTSHGNRNSSRLKWLLLLGFISLLGASDSLKPHRLYSPWNSLGQNTGVGTLSLLQAIFPNHGSNPGLPCYRRILYQLSHKGSPITLIYDSINLSLRLLRIGAKCWLFIRHADRNGKKPKMVMQNPVCREQIGHQGEKGRVERNLADWDWLDTIDIQPVHPKGDQSWVFIGRADVEAETPILWPPDAKNWLIWKDPDAGKDWSWEKEMTEDEMVEWHHRLNGHEFEWTPGVGDGQGGLVCCRPWGCKELDTTERLNWAELIKWIPKENLQHSTGDST